MESTDTHDKDMLDLMDYLERVVKLGENHRKNGEGKLKTKCLSMLRADYISKEEFGTASSQL